MMYIKEDNLGQKILKEIIVFVGWWGLYPL